MNLVEEKQRGLIPPGLQRWPLQLIKHFSNTNSVAPPPAGPAGCRPLYLLHLLNLSLTIWAPNGGCILQFRAYQRWGQVLVFINRHSPTMNLVEEKQRGLIPPGLQRWPLQLIKHFSNTTSVAPPPAGPAGCRPLYLLHLLNLSLTIWAPNGGCILQFRAYHSFLCNLLSTPRCESQVPSKET